MQANLLETRDTTRPALVVTYGSTQRKVRPLDGDLLVIGRGRRCDLGLASPEIAECHCVLYRTPGGWRLRDAGSRIGTRVNGRAVHDVALCNEDVLQVGTFNFRVQLPEPGPAGAPAGGERRLQQSRRRLARLALALRRRLRQERSRRGGSSGAKKLAPRQPEVDRRLSVLHERLRDCEQRSRQLEEQERALAADRAVLAEEATALQSHRQEWEQKNHEEARRLDLRSRELDHFARCLRRTIERLEAELGADSAV
jgi:pSer/pThr/pTyr-binding forkhead associated (FHA) protein